MDDTTPDPATLYTLGRVQPPADPRDADYPFSLGLPRATSTRRYRYWPHGFVKLNQRSEPACVGFTGANWLQQSPVRTKGVTNETGLELYRACKAIDGYNGPGTWDRVLMKVLQQRGHVGRYLWAQNATELDEWLLEVGPVMVGIPWHMEMFYVGSDGFLSGIGGAEVGGHEVLVTGINRHKGFYRLTNSWGAGWGRYGDALIRRDDLHHLLFARPWSTACAAEQQ